MPPEPSSQPGEAASVVTCIDGHEMAKQGRGGTALGIAAIGSFVGGIFATIALIVVAPPLAQVALKFGPPEFFALMLVGLCLITGLGGRSLLAGLTMAILGLLIAMIGIVTPALATIQPAADQIHRSHVDNPPAARSHSITDKTTFRRR